MKSSSLLNTSLSQFGSTRPEYFFLIGLSIWFTINILQSIFTEIGNDEAYYWMYAQRLDWGYFDHPPMIAFFIKEGTLLFDGELGVRLLSILSQLLSLFLIWITIDEKENTVQKTIIFFGLAAAIPVFQMYGFIATPDSPLLLFASLYLYYFKQLDIRPSVLVSVMLAIAAVGLMYSKYHGALLILATLLSNIKLVFNRYFISAAIIAIGLYIPHVLWQYNNGFPTFQFQMIDRVNSIHTKHFFEFWLNQALAFNPLILGLLLFTIFKIPSNSNFDRTLHWVIISLLGFFWITSLWIRPEPHWTAITSIPIIILVYKSVVKNVRYTKFIYCFVLPSIVILLFVRVALIFDFLPFHIEFHKQKEWVRQIESKAGNVPVAFINSYQKPSVYSFYTGKPSFSLNNIYYRKNQFDIWNDEVLYQGKEILFCILPSDSIQIPRSAEKIDRFFVVNDTLHSAQKLRIDFSGFDADYFVANQTQSVKILITNPYPYLVDFNQLDFPLQFSVILSSEKNLIKIPASADLTHLQLLPGKFIATTLDFRMPNLIPGTYNFGVAIKVGILPEAFNSNYQNIEIK